MTSVSKSPSPRALEQAEFLLKTQDIGIMTISPPLLERLAQHDLLVKPAGGRAPGPSGTGRESALAAADSGGRVTVDAVLCDSIGRPLVEVEGLPRFA